MTESTQQKPLTQQQKLEAEFPASHRCRRMEMVGRCANSPDRDQLLTRGIDVTEATPPKKRGAKYSARDTLPPTFLEAIAAGVVPDRIASRVRYDDGCWIWTGAPSNGYGVAAFGDRDFSVHFIVYRILVGPVPEGLELDHLCERRACCNPMHLEPVTCRENILRGKGSRRHATHCKHGHEFTPETTRWKKSASGYPYRQCRVCDRIAAWKAYKPKGERKKNYE